MPPLPLHPHKGRRRRPGDPDPRRVTPPDTPESVFERFREFTKRLINVPKTAIDAQERKRRTRRKRRRQ